MNIEKRAGLRMVTLIVVAIVFISVLLVLSFLFIQQNFEEKAADTAENVEDSVDTSSKVLIDILREDIREVEAEENCEGEFVNGTCLDEIT